MTDRICFFSANDLSISYYLDKVDTLLTEYANGKIPVDINDHLELYNIALYYDSGLYLKKWDADTLTFISNCKNRAILYISQLDRTTITVTIGKILPCYTQNFFDIISSCSLERLLTSKDIETITSGNDRILLAILKCKKLVNVFGTVLAKIIILRDKSAEWMLDSFVVEHKDKSYRTVYFPKELTLQQRESIIEKYIGSEKPNINYVRLVYVVKNSKDLRISPKLQLKAKRKEKELNDKLFEGNSGIPIKFTVEIDNNRNASLKSVKYDEDKNPILCYGARFIESCAAADIIHYCKDVFEYTDSFNFINLISKESEADTFEKLIGLSGKNAYPQNFGFRYNSAISLLQIVSMSNVLENKGRRIEDSLKSFYESYLPRTYHYPKLDILLPSSDSSFAEKCIMLLSTMDSVLRQYDIYATEGMVDLEILKYNKPVHTLAAHSTIHKKYFVLKDVPKDLSAIFFLLFSDQSMLSYVDPYKKEHHKNLYELFSKGKDIDYNSYEDYQKPRIDYLIEQKVLLKDDNGVLKIVSIPFVVMLHHLYMFRAVPYWYANTQSAPVIDDFKQRGWVEEQNTLFTPEEYKYFSYWLNNELFTNGPALRNNYLHGNISVYSENEHKNNYYRIIQLFILLFIKIEEDLALKKSIETTNARTNFRPLSDIAKILTYQQVIQNTDNVEYIAVPKKFNNKFGYAVYNRMDILSNGYGIVCNNEYILMYLEFVLNSSIVRTFITAEQRGASGLINKSILGEVNIPALNIHKQSACATLETMILSCMSDTTKYNSTKRRLLSELREYICLELYAESKLHDHDIFIIDNWVNEIETLIKNNQTEANIAFDILYQRLLTPGNPVMDNVKKARVVIQKISEED